MRKIRALIVDDEPLAREGIALLTEADPGLEIVGQCADGRSALEEIRALRPDLVFLDVQMPGLDGLEVLAGLRPEERPAVIFVTAHDRYAVRAFEIPAVDYLLKPFDDARFHAALGRARERILGSAAPAPRRGPSDRAAFKVGDGYLFFDTAEIVWIEAQGDRVRLAAGGHTHLARESLQSVERRLDPQRFLRVHRSFLVNAARIKRIVPAFYGDYDLIMSDGAKIRIGRGSREALKALLPPRSE